MVVLAALLHTLPAQAQGAHGSGTAPRTAPQASGAAAGCAPQITDVHAVRGQDPGDVRRGPPTRLPASAWTPVTLPDRWSDPHRWPHFDGEVWYRIDWRLPCPSAPGAAATDVALSLDSLNMAGEVWLNGTLLWRDRHLTEPLSRSWFMPRYWLLPAHLLRPDANAVWVRVLGLHVQSPGLGGAQIGPADGVFAAYQNLLWRQRTLLTLNLAVSGTLGVLFFFAWAMRRSEKAYGWYALAAFTWVLYAASLLATETWPFRDSVMAARANMTALVLYVAAFSVFTARFAARPTPRMDKALALLVFAMVAMVWLCTVSALDHVLLAAFLGAALIYLLACLRFVVWALQSRQADQLMLAACLTVFAVVGAHDVLILVRLLPDAVPWTPYSSLAVTLCMALVLGWRLAHTMRRIERFNVELTHSVAHARAELQTTMAREHALVLRNTRLNERLGIAHELHDGLGGSLVRSIAMVEQARAPLENRQVLSILKLLRDDLRQMIDSGSSTGVTVPATPQQWLAPLRHRFTRLFDELDIRSSWHYPPDWQQPPNALQCLALTRVVEEALTNVIKHSRASQVDVTLAHGDDQDVVLRIEDDGVGFDVNAVQAAGVSVGMRSMQARIARVGGELYVQSVPGGTVLTVHLLPALMPDSAPAPLYRD
ncbi:histidine kinase [Ottowia sp. GY511]|nr:histidine kinase [Ottowia sp. GY511]